MLLNLTDQERELVGFILCDQILAMCRESRTLPHSDPNRARTIIDVAVLNDVLSKLTLSQSITIEGETP